MTRLLLSGQWFQLVLLAKWTHQDFPTLCPKFEREWLQQRIGACSKLPEPSVLSAGSVDTIVAQLRRAVKGEFCNRDDLEFCVSALQAHKNSLHPHCSSARKLLDLPGNFLRQILAGMDLRSRGQLKQHAVRFLECLPEAMRPSTSAWVQDHFAGASSLKQGHLYLDIALLLFHRAHMQEQGEVFRYAWGDSSKKGHMDMYNTRQRWLPCNMAVQLARAFRWLIANPAVVDADEDGASEDDVSSQLLYDNMHLHTQIPQLLGQGRSKLVDKVGAHIHSVLLEEGCLEGLSSALSSCISWCSDMGTESGLPSCVVTAPEEVLPEHVRPPKLVVDTEGDGGFVEPAFHVRGHKEAEAKNLMPKALHIPGVCHAIHNASASLESSFSHWEAFLLDLKTLHKFVGSRGRRDRFLEVVLREGSPEYAQGRSLLRNFSHSLHTERWGEVAAYLQDCLPIFVFVRHHWDEVAYVRGMDAAPSVEDGFEATGLTKILLDPWYLAYWEMQLCLRTHIFKLLRWSEGCACHESVLAGKTPHLRDAELRSEIAVPKTVPCRCPASGCRAPEMVAGKLDDLAKSLRGTSFGNFMADSHVTLSAELWGDLRQEWLKGAAYIVEDLKVRLDFFQHLPWVILGGCHHDVGEARRQLRRAIELWEKVPQDAQSLQHHLCQHLFLTDNLRDELLAFVSGYEPLSAYAALETFLAPLTFVPIAERIIEAAHKELGSVSAQKSPTQYSIALRVPEMTQLLDIQPESFSKLVEAFTQARNLREFAQLFPGHGCHPDLVALESKAPTSKRVVVIRRLLYRDTRVQHGNLSKASRVHDHGSQLREKEARKFQPKKPSVDEGYVFADACTQQLREASTHDPSQVVSLGDKFFMPLMLRPSSIHQPAHAPGTLTARAKNDMIVSVLANVGAPELPIVSAMHDAASTESFSVLPHVVELGLDTFLETFRFWSKPEKVLLSLPSVADGHAVQVAKVLEYLTERGCFDSKSAAVRAVGAKLPLSLKMMHSCCPRPLTLLEMTLDGS